MKNAALYILAVIIILATTALIALLCIRETPAANKDAIMMCVGALLAAFGTVVGYFFGSSKGSADKTAALTQKSQNENNPPNPS